MDSHAQDRICTICDISSAAWSDRVSCCQDCRNRKEGYNETNRIGEDILNVRASRYPAVPACLPRARKLADHKSLHKFVLVVRSSSPSPVALQSPPHPEPVLIGVRRQLSMVKRVGCEAAHHSQSIPTALIRPTRRNPQVKSLTIAGAVDSGGCFVVLLPPDAVFMQFAAHW